MEREVCPLHEAKGYNQYANTHSQVSNVHGHVFLNLTGKFNVEKYAEPSEAGSESVVEKHLR